MSYDLMVFRKQAAPKSRAEFLQWYIHETDWANYDDPVVACTELNSWFLDMIEKFPAMDGPYAVADEDEENVFITGYSIGGNSIYVNFRWSVAEQAYQTVFALAKKHGVGFYDVSSDEGDIFFPENGDLIKMNRDGAFQVKNDESQKVNPWWKFW